MSTMIRFQDIAFEMSYNHPKEILWTKVRKAVVVQSFLSCLLFSDTIPFVKGCKLLNFPSGDTQPQPKIQRFFLSGFKQEKLNYYVFMYNVRYFLQLFFSYSLKSFAPKAFVRHILIVKISSTHNVSSKKLSSYNTPKKRFEFED